MERKHDGRKCFRLCVCVERHADHHFQRRRHVHLGHFHQRIRKSERVIHCVGPGRRRNQSQSCREPLRCGIRWNCPDGQFTEFHSQCQTNGRCLSARQSHCVYTVESLNWPSCFNLVQKGTLTNLL